VHRAPGTLSYVPSSSHRHHGIPPSSQEILTANQPPNSPFEIRRHSAQQQQLTHNHWQCSTPQQQQTMGRCYSTHTQCTTRANRPELRNNKSQEFVNNKSQETNDNGILDGISITGSQLQHTIMTDHTDGFTPIVCDSRQKYSQPTFTPRSYNKKNQKQTTNQQLTTQNRNDLILSTRKGEGRKTSAHNNHIQQITTHDDPYPELRLIPVNNHKPDTPRHTTTAPNPIPPPFTGNRTRIACIRRKGETDQQRSQQKPHSPALTAVSCAPSLIRDTIVPLMQNPPLPTNCNPTQTTKAFISSPIAFPCKIHNDKGPAHQSKSQICDNSPTLLPIDCSSRLGTTVTQQPSDIKGDISTDPPSCNEALLFSSATNPLNSRRNSIPYSRAYRYRTFCTTYGNPVKPGSIWHFRSRHHLLQHPSEPTVILRRYHLQQAPTELQRTPPNTKYTSPFKSRNDKTAPSLDTQLNMQTLPTIHIREPGRPGPPWPPPTNHIGV